MLRTMAFRRPVMTVVVIAAGRPRVRPGAHERLVKRAHGVTLPPDAQAQAEERVHDPAVPGVQRRDVGTVVVHAERHDGCVDEKGQLYFSQEGTEPNLRHLSAGVALALLQLYPGAWDTSLADRLASLENLGWYVLYVLALVGAWRAGAVAWWLLSFPAPFAGVNVAATALSQGDAGGAFRHRGRILRALLVAAGPAAVRTARA